MKYGYKFCCLCGKNGKKMTNKLGSANPNRIPNWNKRMDFELDKLLAKNNLTRKDVKLHNAEYYPNGSAKLIR